MQSSEVLGSAPGTEQDAQVGAITFFDIHDGPSRLGLPASQMRLKAVAPAKRDGSLDM